MDSLEQCCNDAETRARQSTSPLLVDCSLTTPVPIIYGINDQHEKIPVTHKSFLAACDLGLGMYEPYSTFKKEVIHYLKSHDNLIVDTVDGEGGVPVLFTPQSYHFFSKKKERIDACLAEHYPGKDTPSKTILEDEYDRYNKYLSLFRQKNENSPFQRRFQAFRTFEQTLFSLVDYPHSMSDKISIPQVAAALYLFRIDSSLSPAILLTKTKSAVKWLENLERTNPSDLQVPTFRVSHTHYTPADAYMITVSRA